MLHACATHITCKSVNFCLFTYVNDALCKLYRFLKLHGQCGWFLKIAFVQEVDMHVYPLPKLLITTVKCNLLMGEILMDLTLLAIH